MILPLHEFNLPLPASLSGNKIVQVPKIYDQPVTSTFDALPKIRRITFQGWKKLTARKSLTLKH